MYLQLFAEIVEYGREEFPALPRELQFMVVRQDIVNRADQRIDVKTQGRLQLGNRPPPRVGVTGSWSEYLPGREAKPPLDSCQYTEARSSLGVQVVPGIPLADANSVRQDSGGGLFGVMGQNFSQGSSE